MTRCPATRRWTDPVHVAHCDKDADHVRTEPLPIHMERVLNDAGVWETRGWPDA